MITRTDTPELKINYALEKRYPPADLAIFDIETTGFSPKTAYVYLIGVLYYKNETWQLIQWMSERPEEEPLLLEAFFHFMQNFTCLIHFNGDAFDLPFLKKRCRDPKLLECLENIKSVDLYKEFRPLKKFLKLSAMNLKSLELYLDVQRKDKMSGGELIGIYHQFIRDKTKDLESLLLLHNHDDMLGTASLFSFFSYLDLLKGEFQFKERPAADIDEADFSLIIRLILDSPVPKKVSLSLPWGYVTIQDFTCNILIHGISDTLKYFFSDYKNYYYLPEEDTAIHKSVASYVDKEHRIPAKAATCYCRKSGLFIPGNEASPLPHFKKDFQAAEFYQEYTNEFSKDSYQLKSYITRCLNLF